MKTKFVTSYLRINLDTARPLARNGRADAEVTLMVADLADGKGQVAYVETNGDPVVWDAETCLIISYMLSMDAAEVVYIVEDATGNTGEFADAVRQALANR